MTTLTAIQPRPPDTTITRNNLIEQRREEEKGQVKAAAGLAKRGGSKMTTMIPAPDNSDAHNNRPLLW
jgi:hypothetical protein